ncbi:hypothetical protein D3C85_1029570 [compost metagenome]
MLENILYTDKELSFFNNEMAVFGDLPSIEKLLHNRPPFTNTIAALKHKKLL